MIRDRGQFEFFSFAPTPGTFATSGNGWDLNPDFGQGHNPRKAPLPGQGKDVVFHVQVSAGFVIGNGTPIAQIHVALSNTGAIGASLLHTGSDFLVIGTLAPSEHTVGGRTHMGLAAAQLTVGTDFFMRVNPWAAAMGRNRAGSTVIGKDLRYMGLAVTVPNFDVGSNTGFSAGTLFAKIVDESDILATPQDFSYPSGVSFVG